MKKTIATLLMGLTVSSLYAQTYLFDFNGQKKAPEGAIRITTDMRLTADNNYGYDLMPVSPDEKTARFFSVRVPDGNYRVTVTLGSKRRAGVTTLRAESRRLFLENVATRKGEQQTYTFTVNKRDTLLANGEQVRIKPRERSKLNWDDKLTFEINGDAPCLTSLLIEPATEGVTTLFLAGNSTVVDQDYEPWASWGQMITRFFDEHVAIANYAESGERADTFIGVGRLKKALSQMKPGDYMFIEFGHNDQKLKGSGKGAYYFFATQLKFFVDEVRRVGGIPVFITPTQRRRFDEQGRILETHADYPDAMRWVAGREQVPVIELHDMTRTLYETMGVEASKKAFVHYPAGTYPGQDKELADNTHFNPYGAYQIAKCVIEGMKQLKLPFLNSLRPDYQSYQPSQPDPVESFHWNDCPFFESLKPDGN